MIGALDEGRAAHDRRAGGCHGRHLPRAPDLGVIGKRRPEAASEARHGHARARRFFRGLLAGRLRIEAEGSTRATDPGQGPHLAPGDAYRVRDEPPGEARALVAPAPPAQGGPIAALREVAGG